MCGLTIQFCGLTIQSGFRHRREYACLGLTTSEVRVYTPESRQATARNTNSAAKNRTWLGDCENQPWQCPTHGGNSECDTMCSKIVWIRQAYLEMRSPDWIFFIWMWLAVFHYLWWLVLFSDVDDHKGCQDFTSFLILLKNPWRKILEI